MRKSKEVKQLKKAKDIIDKIPQNNGDETSKIEIVGVYFFIFCIFVCFLRLMYG